MSGFVEGTPAEKMGGLVENTAEKVARTAERLSELTGGRGLPVVSGTLAQRAEGSRPAIQRDELNKSAVQDRKDKLAAPVPAPCIHYRKRHMLSTHMDFYQRGILKGNPTSPPLPVRFEALKELRETWTGRIRMNMMQTNVLFSFTQKYPDSFTHLLSGVLPPGYL